MKRLVTVVIAVLALLAPAALATGMLSGKYKTKITGEPAAVNGTLTITFRPGHYKVAHNGTPTGGGRDKVKGDKITFYAPGSCDTGKYKFKLSGKKLRFTTISDSCVGRRDVLTHGPFHKVG